jgi:hypothetical protein
LISRKQRGSLTRLPAGLDLARRIGSGRLRLDGRRGILDLILSVACGSDGCGAPLGLSRRRGEGDGGATACHGGGRPERSRSGARRGDRRRGQAWEIEGTVSNLLGVISSTETARWRLATASGGRWSLACDGERLRALRASRVEAQSLMGSRGSRGRYL